MTKTILLHPCDYLTLPVENYIQQDAIICDRFIHDVQLSTGEVKNSDFSTLLIRDVTEIDTREYKEFPEQMKDF